jgi:hypothetical protein
MTFKSIKNLILNQDPEDKLFFTQPFLRLSELPTRKHLSYGNLDKQLLKPNQIWIGCENRSDDILKGATFDILFPHHSVKEWIETKIILKKIYVKLHSESGCLPCGKYAVCLLQFEQGIPEILTKLRVDGEVIIPDKHEIFYLAQRNVYEKMQSFIEREQDV